MTDASTKEPEAVSQLDGLIERLEKASRPDREIDLDIWCELFAPDAVAVPLVEQWTGPRYTASVDAALTLVPEGSLWSLCDMEEGPFAQVMRPMHGGGYVGGLTTSKGHTPAIALCIAALMARQ